MDPGGGGRRLLGLGTTLLVESIAVLCRPLTQLFGLALASLRPGVPLDRLYHLRETATGHPHSHLLAQRVRIQLLWQVQCRVERMETLPPWGAVAEPLDLHLSEEALELAAVQAPLGAQPPVATPKCRPDVARASDLQPALQAPA